MCTSVSFRVSRRFAQTCPELLARLLNVTGRGSGSGLSVMKAVIDGSGQGVEIVLRDDARELQRLTIFEFEQFVQNLKEIAREARAETTRRARLAHLPMKELSGPPSGRHSPRSAAAATFLHKGGRETDATLRRDSVCGTVGPA